MEPCRCSPTTRRSSGRVARAALVQIPAEPLEHRPPGDREAHVVRHLRARHEADRGRRGQPEQVEDPLAGDPLERDVVGVIELEPEF